MPSPTEWAVPSSRRRPGSRPGRTPLDRARANRIRGAVGAAVLFTVSSQLHAADIRRLDVSRDGDRYHVEMEVHLDVPAQRAYEVFADPAQLPRINESVKVATKLIEPGANNRLYTEVRLCISLFCHTLRQVQDMGGGEQAGGWLLTADVIPARSELSFGHAEWRFAALGSQTDLRLRLDLEPSFWVPPFFGPMIVQRLLREQAEVTSAGIERLAAS